MLPSDVPRLTLRRPRAVGRALLDAPAGVLRPAALCSPLAVRRSLCIVRR
ncbi:hypothetical protein [Nonomuraea phyllanthi]|nr:hypothetical protein [Nonomuraea phyllanthi]